ncbi:MAG: hypothetical protein Q9208_005719 [Pyrenodesmia sp. 3 TL-2023]
MRTQLSLSDAARGGPSAFHPASSANFGDPIYSTYSHHSNGPRVNTNTVLTSALRKQYPDLHLTITYTYSSDLLGFAAAGHAIATPSSTSDEPLSDEETASSSSTDLPSDLKWRHYVAPLKRDSLSPSHLVDSIKFGRFAYRWSSHNYILYTVVGTHTEYDEDVTYLLSSSDQANDSLLLAAGSFVNELHDQIWVFDQGYWQKSHKLWESVQNSIWDDVILDTAMKNSIMGEVNKFFGSEERYKKLKVPWKRGIIYYGPPGNGKTISIKATMNTLSHRSPTAIPSLYVRSLASYRGPEYAISSIFAQARKQAPCLLVFEDLDSVVTDAVRSYFLNEVDGLESNDGILMIGSTNHLERLDKGIRNRPSRFDRKYLFPVPGLEEREAYCHFWRRKLGLEDGENEGKGEGEVEFPMVLCKAIAGITGGFSFAYIQEAFVASLLAIAEVGDDGDGGEGERDMVGGLDPIYEWDGRWGEVYVEGVGRLVRDEDKDLEQYVLWREMKKQVKILRDELDAGKGE